jgi:hypothetical protein
MLTAFHLTERQTFCRYRGVRQLCVRAMAEQYEIDQSASRASGPNVVVREEITIINELGLDAPCARKFGCSNETSDFLPQAFSTL